MDTKALEYPCTGRWFWRWRVGVKSDRIGIPIRDDAGRMQATPAHRWRALDAVPANTDMGRPHITYRAVCDWCGSRIESYWTSLHGALASDVRLPKAILASLGIKPASPWRRWPMSWLTLPVRLMGAVASRARASGAAVGSGVGRAVCNGYVFAGIMLLLVCAALGSATYDIGWRQPAKRAQEHATPKMAGVLVTMTPSDAGHYLLGFDGGPVYRVQPAEAIRVPVVGERGYICERGCWHVAPSEPAETTRGEDF